MPHCAAFAQIRKKEESIQMHYTDLRDQIIAKFSKYSQDIMELSKMASKSDIINPKLYEKYDVKRGLRDINGNGVVC